MMPIPKTRKLVAVLCMYSGDDVPASEREGSIPTRGCYAYRQEVGELMHNPQQREAWWVRSECCARGGTLFLSWALLRLLASCVLILSFW